LHYYELIYDGSYDDESGVYTTSVREWLEVGAVVATIGITIALAVGFAIFKYKKSQAIRARQQAEGAGMGNQLAFVPPPMNNYSVAPQQFSGNPQQYAPGSSPTQQTTAFGMGPPAGTAPVYGMDAPAGTTPYHTWAPHAYPTS